MTKLEQQELQLLRESIFKLTNSLVEFKNDTTAKIENIESRVKTQPISLETMMLSTIQNSMVDSIKSVLSGYKSPITPLIEEVINRNRNEIVEQLNSAISSAISITHEDFTNQIKHKIIKSIADTPVSQSGGLVDKTFNDLKQNPAFRAKLTIMIDSLLTEFK